MTTSMIRVATLLLVTVYGSRILSVPQAHAFGSRSSLSHTFRFNPLLRASSTDTPQDTTTHGLAILTMPSTSVDRIANDAILATALQKAASSTKAKLSIILRNKDSDDAHHHSLATLRRYVGEVYSSLWDSAMEETFSNKGLLDVVVYPQNLPNAAPERWVSHRPDLQWICSHDTICGWKCDASGGRGTQFVDTEGSGGLQKHVEAVNADREARNLPRVEPLFVEHWPEAAQSDAQVVFLDDDEGEATTTRREEDFDDETDQNEKDTSIIPILGGAVIPSQSLFNSVCVGGTFDGMHYGHRKLLTLALSSVFPGTGRLLVGVTVDEMLQHKQHSELIPPYAERAGGVVEFLHRLAPGMKNRIQVVPIRDAYGPPGSPEQSNGDFEALVLSHETLDTGHLLNRHREVTLGLPPLTLLCTRRTEPNGMSSTAMRRLRNLRQNQQTASSTER